MSVVCSVTAHWDQLVKVWKAREGKLSTQKILWKSFIRFLCPAHNRIKEQRLNIKTGKNKRLCFLHPWQRRLLNYKKDFKSNIMCFYTLFLCGTNDTNSVSDSGRVPMMLDCQHLHHNVQKSTRKRLHVGSLLLSNLEIVNRGSNWNTNCVHTESKQVLLCHIYKYICSHIKENKKKPIITTIIPQF